MDDYKKAIEDLETTQDDIITDEDEELLQDTNQIDDLTVSNVGLTQSSDIVLEEPTIAPLPREAVQPHPLVSTETQALESVLNIPTPEVYEAIMSDTVHSQATEVGFRDKESLHLNMALIPCHKTILNKVYTHVVLCIKPIKRKEEYISFRMN